MTITAYAYGPPPWWLTFLFFFTLSFMLVQAFKGWWQ